MKSVKRVLKNTRAEGHIDTGVKIIIAVVVGALLLGGLYLLFSNVILPKMNSNVQELMHYAEDPTHIRYDAYDSKLTSMQYSYDGTTWYDASVPELSENAVIKKKISSTEKGFHIALVNDNDTVYIIITEDNGVHWSIARNICKLSLAAKRVEYSLSQSADGTYSVLVRTYDGDTPTSGWGYSYKSNDGRSWYADNLGIDFF